MKKGNQPHSSGPSRHRHLRRQLSAMQIEKSDSQKTFHESGGSIDEFIGLQSFIDEVILIFKLSGLVT
jgi:hypothetical protein